MAAGELNSRQTLALILGASAFPRSPKMAHGQQFYNSAQDFLEYLTASDGLGLPAGNVNWSLFDDSRSPGDQLRQVRDFLEKRSSHLRQKGTPAQDLIVSYVGHGLFAGPDYCLAVRGTEEGSESFTSIRVRDLAAALKEHARFLRKFLIFDCCFSAQAYKEFQSAPITVARLKVLEELPRRGTTLLCSSSANDASVAPEGHPRTMFSESLLRVLHQGDSRLGPKLSLSELGDLVKLDIRETYKEAGVRPEVHSPDQREGDIANLALFPNAGFISEEPNTGNGNDAVHERLKRSRGAVTAGRIIAPCVIFFLLGTGSAQLVANVASADRLLYYILAAIFGLIAGTTYAFALFDRFPVARLYTCLMGGCWALGWIMIAHPSLTRLAGILGGVFIPLWAFVRRRD